MHKLCFLLFLLVCSTGFAQKSLLCSQYYYLYSKRPVSIVPAVMYEGARNNHFMARYNFEAEETVSVTAGKTYSSKGTGLSFTPALGILAGSSFGFSVNMQTSFEKGRFFGSTEPLYCYFLSGTGQYLYNWAEAGIQTGSFFFAGAALQSTKEQGVKGWDQQPGLFAGCTIGNVEIPLYLFSAANGGTYMVLGLQWRLSKAQNQ